MTFNMRKHCQWHAAVHHIYCILYVSVSASWTLPALYTLISQTCKSTAINQEISSIESPVALRVVYSALRFFFFAQNGAEFYTVKLKTVVLSHYIITTAPWMINCLFMWPYYIISRPLGEWINGPGEAADWGRGVWWRVGSLPLWACSCIHKPCVPSVLNADVCASFVPIVLRGQSDQPRASWCQRAAELWGRWRMFHVTLDLLELLWYEQYIRTTSTPSVSKQHSTRHWSMSSVGWIIQLLCVGKSTNTTL